MKTFIISDIHSNLEALKTFTEFYDRFRGDKEVVCLGDIVGYGPNPAECLEILITLTDKIVMGNHDHAVIEPEGETLMNRYARSGVRFSRQCLTEEHKRIISGFPFSIEEEDIIYTHSTPVEPERWRYIDDEYSADRYLEEMEHSLGFVGHSHIPGLYSTGRLESVDGISGALSDENISISATGIAVMKETKTIVNVGSIGQPRDHDPRLCFVIFDRSEWTMEEVRLEYNTGKVYKRIQDYGLPSFLGERLIDGI
ncbi:MAG: hypothetical protein GF307_13990 [candidate division Zixibacteria bacterium]|nr:hypothetical protein [candidate division Zixibacteria bacterium]